MSVGQHMGVPTSLGWGQARPGVPGCLPGCRIPGRAIAAGRHDLRDRALLALRWTVRGDRASVSCPVSQSRRACSRTSAAPLLTASTMPCRRSAVLAFPFLALSFSARNASHAVFQRIVISFAEPWIGDSALATFNTPRFTARSGGSISCTEAAGAPYITLLRARRGPKDSFSSSGLAVFKTTRDQGLGRTMPFVDSIQVQPAPGCQYSTSQCSKSGPDHVGRCDSVRAGIPCARRRAAQRLARLVQEPPLSRALRASRNL